MRYPTHVMRFIVFRNVLQEGPGLALLIVVTDSPLLWRSGSVANTNEHSSAAQASPADTAGRGAATDTPKDASSSEGGHRRRGPSWHARPKEVAALLEMLFEWATNDQDYTGEKTTLLHVAGTQGYTRSLGHFPKGNNHPAMADLASRSLSSAKKMRLRKMFSVVCPAARVRRNIETYVKDNMTGRVAVQWSLASRESGELQNGQDTVLYPGREGCLSGKFAPNIWAACLNACRPTRRSYGEGVLFVIVSLRDFVVLKMRPIFFPAHAKL